MDKVSERIQVSITEKDKKKLEELKEVFYQSTYSGVVRILIRYHSMKK